jgi:hypothetical protein
MDRIHLIISAAEPKEGQPVRTQCGATVQQPKIVPLPDFSPQNSVLFCRDCFNKRYWWAVTEAQNAIDIEIGRTDEIS